MLTPVLALALKCVGAVGIMDTHPASWAAPVFFRERGQEGPCPDFVLQQCQKQQPSTRTQKDQGKVSSSFSPLLIKPFPSQPMSFLIFVLHAQVLSASGCADTREDVPAQL